MSDQEPAAISVSADVMKEGVDHVMVGLPPGPRLPVAVQTILIWRYWVPFLRWCRRRYGDTFTVQAAPTRPLVYVTRRADIAAVFTGPASIFHAGEANQVLAPVLGPRSVLLVDEDDHLYRRRLMLPAFHGDAVRRHEGVIREVTEAEMALWPRGTPFRLKPRMQAITLEVILRAIFGIEDHGRLQELRELLPRLVQLDGVTMLMWLKPGLGRIWPWRRYRRLQERIDSILLDEIVRRRNDPELGERTDVLSLLIRARDEHGDGLGDADLRDQLLTLLMAGHETTATALAWAFERLLRNRPVLARLREELPTGGTEYLDAVIKETLRVRPIIADVVRKLTVETEVAGYRLPAGAVLTPAIALIQRSPEHYPEPEEFRPERFLGKPSDPYAWIPFGGGSRRCLGAAFAQMEMRVVLSTVLGSADLVPARTEAEKVKVNHITLVPSRGAEVVWPASSASRA